MQQSFDYRPLDRLRLQSSSSTIVILVFLVMFGVSFFITNYQIVQVLIYGVIAVFVASGIWGLYRQYRSKKSRSEVLKAFALANKLAYHPGSTYSEDQPGVLFKDGGNRKLHNILEGSLRGLPFRSYEYYYETGSGKYRQQHDAMVVEFTLPRVLPQFIIDSELESVISINFDKSQKIELEGDFHKYFDLYAPDQYGISALTILAPDAMEVLMQHAALCDIEVVQNKLYFYWPVPAVTKDQYQQLFDTTIAVLDKIGDTLVRRDIYANSMQSRIHAEPNAEGVRLKDSNLEYMIIAAFIVTFLAHISLPFEWGLLVSVLFWGWLLAWSAMGSFKQYRVKREYLSKYKRRYDS